MRQRALKRRQRRRVARRHHRNRACALTQGPHLRRAARPQAGRPRRQPGVRQGDIDGGVGSDQQHRIARGAQGSAAHDAWRTLEKARCKGFARLRQCGIALIRDHHLGSALQHPLAQDGRQLRLIQPTPHAQLGVQAQGLRRTL